jgi:sortase B
MRSHRHDAIRIAARLLGWMLVTSGLALVLTHRHDARAIEKLSADVRVRQQTTAGEAPGIGISSGPDWESLKAINPDVAAWVRVENTDIDLPVMAPSDADMTYYLQHDLWRKASLDGTPFLDHRCEADARQRLVYGHHLFLGGQFSALQRAYRQEVFEKTGDCVWSTPSGGTTRLKPLCALRRNAWFAGIQRFDLPPDQLESWLLDLSGEAEATAANCEQLAKEACSTVALVTCSSELSGQPWRTIVVFVEVGSG